MTCQHHEYMQTVAESRAKAGAELPTELGDPSVHRFSPDTAEQRANIVCVCLCESVRVCVCVADFGCENVT